MPPGAVQRFCGLLSELLGVKLGHQRLAVQAGIVALGAPEKPANEIQQALFKIERFTRLSSSDHPRAIDKHANSG